MAESIPAVIPRSSRMTRRISPDAIALQHDARLFVLVVHRDGLLEKELVGKVDGPQASAAYPFGATVAQRSVATLNG